MVLMLLYCYTPWKNLNFSSFARPPPEVRHWPNTVYSVTTCTLLLSS